MENATGWTELLDANMPGAVYVMFNTALGGWFVALLFFTYHVMLYMKTKNLPLCFITGVIFVSMYAFTIDNWVWVSGISVMFVLLLFELAAIMYYLIWG